MLRIIIIALAIFGLYILFFNPAHSTEPQQDWTLSAQGEGCVLTHRPASVPGYVLNFVYAEDTTTIGITQPGVSFPEMTNMKSIQVKFMDGTSIEVDTAKRLGDDVKHLQLGINGNMTEAFANQTGVLVFIESNDTAAGNSKGLYRFLWMTGGPWDLFSACATEKS